MTKLLGRAKPGAFDPSPHAELSVAHTTGLTNSEVWGIGWLTLSAERGRGNIYGRADIPVGTLNQKKLRAVRDDVSFLRHTTVTGWPDPADADQAKQMRKQICLELSLAPEIKLVVPESLIAHSAEITT